MPGRKGDQQPPAGGQRQELWYLGFGLFLYFAGVVMFFYFTHLEKTGESASINAVVALMYKLGGKWLVSGFCAVAGTGFLVAGIVGLIKRRD